MTARRTRIKICGIRTKADALAASHAGADAVGFVFAKRSPRFIEMAAAADIARSLPPFVSPVGLFAPAESADEVRAWPFGYCQLHGDENEPLISQIAQHHRVIRGFRFDPSEVRRWSTHPDVAALLIDGSTGGRGESFNHVDLAPLMPELHKPVIIAGGLTPENVGNAIATLRPWAVDVSSGVESEPGVKASVLIRDFCAAVRAADQS